MEHPLVLGLFDDIGGATRAARAVHALGVTASELSIVARDHEAEGELSRVLDGTPGAEIEDSRRAGRFGEMSAYVLAAVAVGFPGVGALLAAGPLSAELGEAAGHVAGGLAAVLREVGVDEGVAMDWEGRVRAGAVVLAVHATARNVDQVRAAFERAGAAALAVAAWQ